MPGPRRNARTLRERHYNTRIKRNTTFRQKREATKIVKRDEIEAHKNSLIVAYQIQIFIQWLKETGAVIPENECEGNQLDDQYTLDQVSEIIDQVGEHTTNSKKLEAVAERTIDATRLKYGPSAKITGKNLLLFLLLAWLPAAEAEWYDFSAPVNESTIYDTVAKYSSYISKFATFGAWIQPQFLPTLLPVATASATCASSFKLAGTIQRIVNSRTGKYPMTPGQEALLLIKSANPFMPNNEIKKVVEALGYAEIGVGVADKALNKYQQYINPELTFRIKDTVAKALENKNTVHSKSAKSKKEL